MIRSAVRGLFESIVEPKLLRTRELKRVPEAGLELRHRQSPLKKAQLLQT